MQCVPLCEFRVSSVIPAREIGSSCTMLLSKQPRLEFPNLYTGEDKLHFNSQVANQAYDSMISKAREEALAKFGSNNIVLIVCAGWNAEGDQIASMKEAFCAKQLSLCCNTDDLVNWAHMNSRRCGSYKYNLESMPKVLYQTNRHDHEKLQRLNVAALGGSLERQFYDDDSCERYILQNLGPGALAHYKLFMIAAHRADFFRYVLLFFEGGIYLDIKSCFLQSLSCLLNQYQSCSLLTCIGAGNSHIHQGILMCPARHPLLHAAIHKVMETRPSSLGSRQPEYMTFCRQMWELLQSRTKSNLQIGRNLLDDWGSVCLLQERKTNHRCLPVCNESLRIDGYLAYMQHWIRPVVAIRCENWKHGFKGVQNMNKIDAIAEMNTSALIHQDAKAGIMNLDNEEVLLAKEAAIAQLIHSTKYYNSLRPEELSEFILQGLVATKDGWLGCEHHVTKGRPKKFAAAFCLDTHCVC